MSWIEQRIKDEKRKHAKWTNEWIKNEWIKIASIKIRNEILDLITEEIVIAQKEGQPTSRLTSLFNKINI